MDLAVGFLLSEGVVHAAGDVTAMRYCSGTDDAGRQTYNVLDVALAPDVAPPDRSLERAFYTSSSCGICGICGKASIDAVRTSSAFSVRDDPLQVSHELLAQFPDRLARGPVGLRPHRRAARGGAVRRRHG